MHRVVVIDVQRAALLLVVLGGAVLLTRLRGERAAGEALDSIVVTLRKIAPWLPPARAQPYLPAIERAERDNALPPLLLARLAHQESAYRPEVISGAVKSRAGAVGIVQIVPRWHPLVDPYDPLASIAYAGRYLRTLYQRFGDWRLALAAYNWGEGNLARWRNAVQAGEARAWPAETEQYVREIARDVGLA